jgi:hypothetical protein
MTTAVQQKNDRGEDIGRTATEKPATKEDKGHTATQKPAAWKISAEQQNGRGEDFGRTAKRPRGRFRPNSKTAEGKISAEQQNGNTAAKTGNGTKSYQTGDDDEMTTGTMGRLSRSMHHKMLARKL